MDIPYVQRSEFLEPITRQLAGASFGDRRAILMTLKPGGYRGAYTITIDQGRRLEFHSTGKATDTTRYPVRIRAAVTALRDLGFAGSFRVSHDDGRLEITRL